MVVHELATRIPFHGRRLQRTPGQDPSASVLRRYAEVAADVLNAHGYCGDVWAGVLRYRAEIWRAAGV